MQPYYEDTPQHIENIQINIMRNLPVERKIQLVFELSQAVTDLARSGIKLRYPLSNEEEIDQRLTTLILGKDIAGKIFKHPDKRK